MNDTSENAASDMMTRNDSLPSKRPTSHAMSKPLDRRKFLGSAAALSLSAASYANVPGSNDRVRVAFLGCGGRAQAHIDLVNRLRGARDRPVAPVAVCDVWDGLEDEYDVDFGGKTTRRRYAQGLYPSARKCRLDPRRQDARHEGLSPRPRPQGRGRGLHRHARPLARPDDGRCARAPARTCSSRSR